MIYHSLILTSRVKRWLQRTTAAKVLHVFDQACNLVDPDGQIVSLVKAELGPGPFALVVPVTQSFTRFVNTHTSVSVVDGSLRLGSLTFMTAKAELWQPCPPWARLQDRPEFLSTFLPTFEARVQDHAFELAGAVGVKGKRRFIIAADRLFHGLANHDSDACRQGAVGLAGLGPGLTPTGDDFLVGVIYALWATRPGSVVRELARIMVTAAAPCTTTLSAAWLEAAGRGEAVKPWHDLVQAISVADTSRVDNAVQRILAIGYSSGADALAGFTAGLTRGSGRQ